MRVYLSTIGSTGDFEPFLALSRELIRAGHSVRIGSHDIYAGRARAAGVDFASIGSPVDLDEMRSVREKLRRMNALAQLNYLLKHVFLVDCDRAYQDTLAFSDGFDFAICHAMDFVGQHALIAGGVPWSGVVLCPGVIPSAAYPPLEFPRMGRTANRLLWGSLGLATRSANRRVANALQELDGNRREISVLGTFAPNRNFVAASRYLFSGVEGLPRGFETTGFWTGPGSDVVPGELARFLEDGTPDVVFTFGSMGGAEGRETASIFLEAIQATGIRAVIQRGWGGIQMETNDANVLFLDFAPHSVLFRDARVVVHHGGAGTTHAATAAGCASVIVPHIADQFYWGKVLWELGLAARPIPRKQLTAAKLTRALRRLMQDESYMMRVRETADRMTTEPGVRAVAAALVP